MLQGEAQAAQVRIASAKIERRMIELYTPCELTIALEGKITNPYDPDEVDLQAVFQPARGLPVSVPAFYYQPFSLTMDAGRELLTPLGDPVWKVRFTPPSTGAWSVEIRLAGSAGKQAKPVGEFEVVPSSRRGFVRVDRKTGYFRFDRGETFMPIGENLAWAPQAQALRLYDQWMHDLVKQRANFIRLWLAPWLLRLETPQTGVGRYDQLRAWQLDYLLQRSETLGLYWQLSLLDHGSFSQSQDPEWHRNPYNEQLGGMCRTPSEFLTDPRAKAFFKRLLRYLVARYGYSPNLVSWELFNEADLSELRMEDLPAWVTQMGQALRELDPTDRPITVSFHKAEKAHAIWQLPIIDTIQIHLYDQRDFAELFCGSMIQDFQAQHHKPVMVGEFGWITEFVRGIDQQGIHLHDGLWSSVMGGAMGGAMGWYWDEYIHPKGLERHYRPLAMFWRGEQLEGKVQRLACSYSDQDLVGCGFGTSQRAYLWIKNRTHNVDLYLAYRGAVAKEQLRAARGQQAKSITYPPRVITGATASIRGLNMLGRYRVEWWDPYAGRLLSSTVKAVRLGTLTLEVPELSFDVAAKLIRLRWWERG